MKNRQKSTRSSLTEEEQELRDKIFQNEDYPKATRQYTRDGFLDEPVAKPQYLGSTDELPEGDTPV